MALRLRGALASASVSALLFAAAGPFAAPPAAAATVGGLTSSSAAASWLVGQLAGPRRDHFVGSFTAPGGDKQTFPAYGDTADGVLALDAAAVAQDAAARMTSWLASVVGDYAGTQPGQYYPGALGKLILVAVAQGVDPRSFGGTDLLAALQDEEVSASGPEQGLFKKGDGAGYENVVTQALAIVALRRAGVAVDAAAVDFLRRQQCADGAFPAAFPTGGGCAGDVDATGYAVQALLAAGTDAGSALRWLAAAQGKGGGFGTPANANSTALAVQALTAAGRDAGAARGFLVSLQLGCAAPAAQRGAVTYSGGYDATAVKASVQATQALAGKTLMTASASGSTAATPTLACPAAAPTTLPTATPTHPPAAGTAGTGAAGTGAAGTGADSPTAGAGTGGASGGAVAPSSAPELPYTGPAPLGAISGAAGGLLLAGVALTGLARRRYAGRHRAGGRPVPFVGG